MANRSRSASSWPSGTRRSAVIGSGCGRCAQEIAVGKLSGAMGTFAHQGPDVEEYVCAKLGLTAGSGLESSGAARSPCRLCLSVGVAGGEHRKDCHGDSPSAADGGARSGRIFFRRAEGVVGDAAQAEPDRLGESLRAWRGSCGPIVWRRWRTWRSGMSGTSAIRRSSG